MRSLLVRKRRLSRGFWRFWWVAGGVHKFYLGYTKEGIIQIVLSFLCVGVLIGWIEGIIYLTKSDEEFVATYINGKKGWF